MKTAFRYTRDVRGRYVADHAHIAYITSTISRVVDGWHWAICDEERGGMRADGFAKTLAAAKQTANDKARHLGG